MTGHEGQSVGSHLDDVLSSITNRLDALEAVGTPDPEPPQDPDPDPEPEPPPADPDPDPEPDPEPPPVVPPPTGSLPGPSNTGTTGPLTPSGSVTTTRDGQVIENLRVTGGITVKHNDVLIRNVEVVGTGIFGIQVPNALHTQVVGLVIEDVEIGGVSGTRAAGLAHYGKWIARRLNVHGFMDGVKMLGNQILEDSYIHDLYDNGTSHNDCIQSVGGSNSVIRRNNLVNLPSRTSAIKVTSENNPVDGFRIEDNRLAGGGFTLYLTNKPGMPAPANVNVTGNVWVRGQWGYGPVKIDKGPGLVWSGNTFDDGQTLSV